MKKINILNSIFRYSQYTQHSAAKAQYLYGINPIQLAIAAGKRKIQSVIISESQSSNTSYRITKIINLAREKNIPVLFKVKENMSRLVRDQPHQNVIAKCSVLSPDSALQPNQYEKGIYVFCDKITDPQNMGAIIRSCLFYGVKGIMVSKKQIAPLNSTVSKASAGALELMKIYNIQREQQYLKQWRNQEGLVLSTSVSSQTSSPISPAQCRNILEKQISKFKRVLLVLGSEGAGVSPHLARNSDISVCITRTGQVQYPYSLVDSLNVNTALSCILYELTKK